MKVKIDIDSATFVRFFAVFTGFFLAGYFITLLRTPLVIIFVSFFLALALNPPVSKLASRLPGQSRVWATALSYVLVLMVLGGFMVLAVPPAISQSVAFIQQIPSYVDTIQNQQGPVRGFLQEYGLQGQLDTALDNARERATSLAAQVGSAFVGGVGLILNGIVALLTVLVLTFLMLIEGPGWMRRLWSIYIDDSKKERHQTLVKRMYQVVTSYVNGQVLIAAIAAGSALIVILILSLLFDVPLSAAFPLAGAVFITTMIPMVGATLGGLIVTIVLLFNDVTAALVFLGYFIVYQQVENNFLQPVIQSKSVDLTALSVLIAVLIGISLAGLIGGLVAIPIAACIRILLNDFLESRRKQAAVQPENMLHRVKNMIAKNDKSGKEAA